MTGEWPLGSQFLFSACFKPSPLGGLASSFSWETKCAMKKVSSYFTGSTFLTLPYELPALTLKTSVKDGCSPQCLKDLQCPLSYPACALLYKVFWKQAVYLEQTSQVFHFVMHKIVPHGWWKERWIWLDRACDEGEARRSRTGMLTATENTRAFSHFSFGVDACKLANLPLPLVLLLEPACQAQLWGRSEVRLICCIWKIGLCMARVGSVANSWEGGVTLREQVLEIISINLPEWDSGSAKDLGYSDKLYISLWTSMPSGRRLA